MRIFISILLFLMITTTFVYSQNIQHKVVFQFTNAHDTLQQKAFTNQLNNLLNHWPDVQIEVVNYNQGIEYMMLTKSKHIDAINTLHAKGVKFVVCQNTMNRLKITREQLLPIIEIVPAGIAEIVEKQEQGWSYIKGGF